MSQILGPVALQVWGKVLEEFNLDEVQQTQLHVVCYAIQEICARMLVQHQVLLEERAKLERLHLPRADSTNLTAKGTDEGRELTPEEVKAFQEEFRPRQIPQAIGESCQRCGGFNMVRTGTCKTCQDCGDTSGGCD